MGCILLAFFNDDTGIFMGGKTTEEYVEGELVTTIGGGKLLGV